MSKQKTIWIKDEAYEKLKELAAKENCSLTSMALKAVRKYVDECNDLK